MKRASGKEISIRTRTILPNQKQNVLRGVLNKSREVRTPRCSCLRVTDRAEQ